MSKDRLAKALGEVGREIDFDVVTESYLECAAWSSTAHTGEGTEDDERDLDAVIRERGIDWHEDAKKHARKVCADFVAYARERLGALIFERFDDEQIGHDFWLTRCGHGAGFWDRGVEPEGRLLSDGPCDSFGEDYAYVGDDGAAHFGDELTYKPKAKEGQSC